MSKRIPLEEVPKGVKMSKDKARQHLNDARILIENGSIEGAALLTIHAQEELGRIIILNKRYEKARACGQSFIEIRNRGKDEFYSHQRKQEMAKTIIPLESLRIHKGSFGVGFGKGFDIDTWISQDLREAVVYIDYCDRWQSPPQIDSEKLRNCIEHIEKQLKQCDFGCNL